MWLSKTEYYKTVYVLIGCFLLIFISSCKKTKYENGVISSNIQARGKIIEIVLDKRKAKAGIFTEKEILYKLIKFEDGNFFVVSPDSCTTAKVGETGFIYIVSQLPRRYKWMKE